MHAFACDVTAQIVKWIGYASRDSAEGTFHIVSLHRRKLRCFGQLARVMQETWPSQNNLAWQHQGLDRTQLTGSSSMCQSWRNSAKLAATHPQLRFLQIENVIPYTGMQLILWDTSRMIQENWHITSQYISRTCAGGNMEENNINIQFWMLRKTFECYTELGHLSVILS